MLLLLQTLGMAIPVFTFWVFLATTLVLCTRSVALYGRDLNAPLLDSYDYIVVGCGISGLVVANRLSEDANINVLCIEAGIAYVFISTLISALLIIHRDHYEEVIQVPVFVRQTGS